MTRWCLNIGNTRTACGPEGKAPFAALRFFPTPSFPDDWQMAPEDCAVAACVVPAKRAALAARCGAHIHFITAEDYPQLDFSGYDLNALGADRIANAAALHQLFPRTPAMAIDCGTATNSVVVDAAGRFCGGVILPGRRTARAALARAAAQLPDLPENDLQRLTPLALNTADAIASGVDLGLAGAIRALVEAVHALPGLDGCPVVLCGGDAPFLAELLPASLPVQLLDFSLTLFGVSLARH